MIFFLKMNYYNNDNDESLQNRDKTTEKIDETLKMEDSNSKENLNEKTDIYYLAEDQNSYKEGEYILKIESGKSQYFKISYMSIDSCSFSDSYSGEYSLEKIIYLREGDKLSIQGDFTSSTLEYNSSVLLQNC